MRETLSPNQIAPEAIKSMETYHLQTVNEVKDAITKNKIVVVGMKQNPVVGKARKLLQSKNIEFKYLEYGSYFSMWKPRLAIKLWSGWPTYPQVYIQGQLIGGFRELNKMAEDGKLK